jgi:hypothetical protein
MKFIDDKGRLFGMINVIDFLVLAFLICLIPMLYFGYRIIGLQSPEPPSSKYKEVYLNCQLVKLRPDIAKKVSINDRELSRKGSIIGEVIDLGEIRPDDSDPSLKQRYALLKLRLEFKGSGLVYGDNVVDYNSEIIFKTNEYAITARVTDELSKMLKISITLRDLDDQTIALIKVGDREVDASGGTLAEIAAVGKPTESFREFELGRGKFSIGRVINKKQITTEMILRCQEISNGIYFKGRLLTYDTPIDFVTNKYRVKGFLSRAYEVAEEKNNKQ